LARDFGLRPEDVVGKTNRELFPQDLADKYSADDQRIVETGATEEFDEEYLDKGERRFVHTIKTPVRDEAGTIQGVFGMFRDVTEEKRAEQRLRVANERLEEAQRVAHLGSWEWDPAGDQITGSAEFFRLFDAAPEEIVRYQQFVERLHPDDREHVDRDVAEALEGNRSYDTEYRVRLRDGGWRDINARGRLVTDPDGKPVRFVGTCLDITERKRAEGALRESERWYRTLAISLPHLVWTCRADGPCDYLSPRWVEYTGIPESEQLGYRWLEQLHPDDRDRVIAEWTEVAAHGESFDIEFRIRRADGVHRWFKTRAIPLRDNNGQLVKWFGSNTDIDDVKRASEVLAAVNAELEDRVKARTAALEAANRELEAFSYSVSHDLRAPLRSVDGFSKILLQDHGEQLDAEARRVLGVVIRNVQQMGRLIDDLLAFSRVSRKELERQPVDMGKLARAVAEVLRAAEPERAIEVDIGSLGGTLGDSGLLRQVWVNLLGNAFKFTRPADRPRIEIRCEQVDGECRYTVRDNGVGFDPAYADNLFKPFQRLHPTAEFEGTGIGLAIVARIVQRHGGRVSAEGRPGAGATFGFSLPTSKEDT
jgi:PAS domain S-box-containing protein